MKPYDFRRSDRVFVTIKRLFAVAGILYMLSGVWGCGARAQVQAGITHSAKLTLVDTEDAREAFYEARDERCREEHPPAENAFSAWRSCMDPAYRLKVAVETADHTFRAVQRALDAAEDAELTQRLGPALDALDQLIRALVAAGVPIPGEVLEWSSKLRSLARVFL